MANEDASQVEETGVIICGGGPTGTVLSALLGSMNVPNVVLEKEREITTDPRGIALDEDGIRILQSIGIYDRMYTEIGTCTSSMIITGSTNDFYKSPLIQMDYSTTEGGTGHVGFICHKQPAMEKAIRDKLEQIPLSQLRPESTVVGIDETKDAVLVEYLTADGEIRKLKAPFLVGADGKTGFVRKRYLEDKGVILERCEGSTYDETWVALNWKITLPTEKTHPSFPLWKLGYTPEEVYDLFFPREFRFLCNPKRPSVCGRFGLLKDRLWRFEFVVQKGEDPDRMATFEETSKIIFPYITHPGRRYGLGDNSVKFPEDCIETLRSRPFSFVARSCNRWSQGRVVLAGDSAHVFPPFGGQGIASGFRDALALSWRLVLLHRKPQIDHERVFAAWYLERKQQLEKSLAATIVNGEYVTESDPIKVFIREWYMWAVQLVPSWRREIKKGPRAAGMTRYRYMNGFPFMGDMGGGINLPQVYACDLKTKQLSFTDDLLFSPNKKGLFQLLILPRSVEELEVLTSGLREIDTISNGFIRAGEATVVIQSTDSRLSLDEQHYDQVVTRLATAEEFAADLVLCKNRPPPIGYDEWRLGGEVKNKKFVVLRFDRFTFAACDTTAQLKEAVARIESALHLKALQ